MASTIAIPPPSSPCFGKRTLLRNLRKTPIFSFGERQRCMRMVAKAAGESPDSSTSLSIVKSVQNAWGKPEDRIALVGLGFAAVAALWASSNLFGAVDKLPLIPGILEFIGILFSWWFIYRFLLFKPDRAFISLCFLLEFVVISASDTSILNVFKNYVKKDDKE